MELYLQELVIVESLPQADRQTGTDLHKYLIDQQTLPVPVTLERPRSAAELIGTLHTLATRAEGRSWKPMVHIEVHGSNRGCGAATEEFVPWDALAVPLRRLNVATRNSTIVAVAACKGAYLATAAAGHPFEPAPFCGVVGPEVDTYDKNLRFGFREYYSELAQTKDFQLALHKLQKKWLPQCRAFDSGDIFRKGIGEYSSRWLSGSLLQHRVKRIMRQHARAATPPRYGRGKVSRREIVRRIRDSNDRVDRYWRHFTMADLYPENHARFLPLHPTAYDTR